MRNLILGLVAAALLAGPQTAQAGALSYPSRTIVKLVHGVADIAYSPLELLIAPVTHAIDFDRHNRMALWGAEIGLFTGLVKAEARLGRGASGVITFLLPSERHDRWHWDWSYTGLHTPLSENSRIQDAH